MEKPTTPRPELGRSTYPTLILELRGQSVEHRKGTSQKSGQAYAFATLNLACETTGSEVQQIVVELMSEKGRETIDLLPYPKGSILVVEFSHFETQQGNIRKGRAFHVELFLPAKK